ncbi:MAG: DUF1810 domain-containing protein [Burkholderiales bacterium]
MDDPFSLQRFVLAQAAIYPQALTELQAGRKTSHWMWFIFAQLKVLGRSATALHFGIESLDEARAYTQHPVLGPRLQACSEALLQLPHGTSAHEVFGSPDDLKLCSCMTLFEQAWPDEPVFAQVLKRYFGGRRDALTLQALGC